MSKSKNYNSPSVFSSNNTFVGSPRSAKTNPLRANFDINNKINWNPTEKCTARSKRQSKKGTSFKQTKLIQELDIKENELMDLFTRIKTEKKKLTVKQFFQFLTIKIRRKFFQNQKNEKRLKARPNSTRPAHEALKKQKKRHIKIIFLQNP